MKTRIGAAAALATALACAPAQAAGTPVHVRIEGASRTLFDGTIPVSAVTVDGNDGTGQHACDGTNGGASPTSGPTVTDAVAAAARRGGYIFHAAWSASFSDFLIDQIGPDVGTASRFWTLGADYRALSLGGCQVKLRRGEQVIASYGSTKQSKHELKLTGPRSVRPGQRFRVRVVDGATRKPLRGARVGSARTDRRGFATLRFLDTGVLLLKATRADSVRSNELDVVVRRAKRR